MGVSIQALNENDYVRFPYPMALVLECDARVSLFCRGCMKYEHRDGYVGAHVMAMQDGWLERQASTGRIWLCPACSGKAAS